MFRTYTLLALAELALLGACFGIPEAHADPAELCCNDPRHTECSGCILGYQLGRANSMDVFRRRLLGLFRGTDGVSASGRTDPEIR